MIGIGIIGCGSIAIHRHVPEYASRKDCNLVGFYDPITERAQNLADKFGGKVFESIEQLLADKGIHAVSVCTPNKYHAPASIAALKAGKHVLCEKPMAVSLDEAKSMINTAEECGKFLMT